MGIPKKVRDAEEGIEPSSYAVRDGATIVPRASDFGGIEGTGDAYPPILEREMDGESIKEAKVIHPRRKLERDEPVAIDPRDVKGVEVVMDIEPEHGEQPASPEAGPVAPAREPDTGSTAISRLERRLVELIGNAQPIQEPVKISRPGVKARFEGPFGKAGGTYTDVIDGVACVVLILDEETDGWYEPPEDPESEFTISWQGHVERVYNVGMGYTVPGGGRALVLIKA